ncbi:unnamed protein product, partial [Polarella glacialis]
MAAATDMPDVGQWQSVVVELEDIDRVIRDLKQELQQFASRRQALANQAAQLRPAEVATDGKEKQPETGPALFQVLTPRLRDRGANEPMVFQIAEESPHPDREDPELPAAGRSRGKVSKKGSRQIEDWESGLESFGVAKCGVCGMKFPLDVGAIEKHSLECEAAQKEGRIPARQRVDSATLRIQLRTLARRLHISREEDNENSNDCNAEAAVEEVVDWMSLETVRYALFGASPFAAFNLMAEAFLTHGDWNNYSKTGQFRIYHSHILTLLMIVICATICLIWRSQPGRVIRSFFNIFVLDRTDVLAFRFAMSFATGQPGLTAVLNLVYAALSCHVYKGWVANTPETSTLFGPDSVIEFVCQEFNACFIIILVGWVADMRVFSQARTLIEIKASRATHSSLLMLLSTVCDVVVQLNADFRLVENGERLAAMLLQGAERSLKGICFEDFLFEAADKERLKKHVGRLRHGILGDLGMAIPISVRMRDSNGFWDLLIKAVLSKLSSCTQHMSTQTDGSIIFWDSGAPCVPFEMADAQGYISVEHLAHRRHDIHRKYDDVMELFCDGQRKVLSHIYDLLLHYTVVCRFLSALEVFYIPPCGERQDLRSRIEAGGGAITLLQGGPCVLHIVPKQGARERREPIAPDCVAVSSRFIYRCSDEKELLPLDNFILQDGKLDRYLSPQPLGGETLQQEPQPRPLKRPAAAESLVGVSDPAVAPMKRPAAAATATATATTTTTTTTAVAVAAAVVAVAPATAAASGAAAPEALPARLRFNAAEDDALVRWAKSNPQMRAKGEKLWKAAERAGITPHYRVPGRLLLNTFQVGNPCRIATGGSWRHRRHHFRHP